MNRILSFGCIAVFLFSAKSLSAQSNDSSFVTNVFKLNFFLPGISYEQKVTTSKTIFCSAFSDLTMFTTPKSAYEKRRTKLYPAPTLEIAFRNYFNFKRRINNNRRTAMNSADYIAPFYNAIFAKKAIDERYKLVNVAGAVWGLQRNFSNRFSLDLDVGIGYTFSKGEYWSYNAIYPAAHLRLGFWLNKKVW